MIIKEFKCPIHGSFEGSHPICPAFGCESEGVEREFKTPPSINTGMVAMRDASLRRTAEVYGFSDMSNKDGSSVASNQQSGREAIWGAEGIGEQGYSKMLAQAATPITVKGKTDKNRGMQLASELTGTFGGTTVPVAGEYTVHAKDKRGIQKLKNG